MRVFYINVAAEAARRAAIEAELARHLPDDWPAAWVNAVTPATLDMALAAPGLRPGENACLQSHLRAMAMAAAEPGHALILEDDSRLAPASAELIDGAIASLGDSAWDVLFVDVAIPDPEAMVQLYRLRQLWRAERRVLVLDLARLPFCGSTAYVVNASAIDRVAAVTRANAHGLPYDLLLRQAIYAGELQGRLAFPFLTTVSAAADQSQIQADGARATDLAWNAYRRLAWVGSDLDEVAATLAGLPAADDPASQLLGRIVAAMLSTSLVVK